MPAREFAEPLNEMEQIFRPRHQDAWPIWETRDELKQPWVVGFPKLFVNGQWYKLMQNSSTSVTVANALLEPVITVISESNITKAVGKLDTIITVEVGTTAVTLDQFKGGYLQIKGGTGVGYNFPLHGNTAGGGSANDTIEVYIDGEFPIDLDTTTDIQIVTSPNRNIQLSTGAAIRAVGVNPTTIEADYYFWSQFQGPAIGQAGGAITATASAVALSASSDSGKYVTHAATAGVQTVGYRTDPNAVADDEWFLLELTL